MSRGRGALRPWRAVREVVALRFSASCRRRGRLTPTGRRSTVKTPRRGLGAPPPVLGPGEGPMGAATRPSTGRARPPRPDGMRRRGSRYPRGWRGRRRTSRGILASIWRPSPARTDRSILASWSRAGPDHRGRGEVVRSRGGRLRARSSSERARRLSLAEPIVTVTRSPTRPSPTPTPSPHRHRARRPRDPATR